VFGDELGDLDRVPVTDSAIAALLADADGRLAGVGVAYDAGRRRIRLSSLLGGESDVTDVLDTPRRINQVVESAARAVARAHATRVIVVELEPDAQVPSNAAPIGARDYVPYAGAVVPDGGHVAMLVGPGVVRRGAVAGLRAFAAATGVGVANTWGAKGVVAWDSPHHLGTAGLQARDFELVFAGVETVIATGVDRPECRPPMPAGIAVVEVDPQQLASLGAHAARRSGSIPHPPLYERLAAIAQPGYADERYPYHPARAVAILRDRLPGGGLVTADPGRVGLWIARTFPTPALDPADARPAVVVPATGGGGAATALALAGALRGRPVIACVDAEHRDPGLDAELVALGESLGARFEVQCWGEGDLAIDWSCTDDLVAAAGPVVAWTT
jgi:thiamine pyrophosphate-dependent acetolactate synthase large subunit-like protein